MDPNFPPPPTLSFAVPVCRLVCRGPNRVLDSQVVQKFLRNNDGEMAGELGELILILFSALRYHYENVGAYVVAAFRATFSVSEGY